MRRIKSGEGELPTIMGTLANSTKRRGIIIDPCKPSSIRPCLLLACGINPTVEWNSHPREVPPLHPSSRVSSPQSLARPLPHPRDTHGTNPSNHSRICPTLPPQHRIISCMPVKEGTSSHRTNLRQRRNYSISLHNIWKDRCLIGRLEI